MATVPKRNISQRSVEAFIGDAIIKNEDRDESKPADDMDSQLSIEQPKKQKF